MPAPAPGCPTASRTRSTRGRRVSPEAVTLPHPPQRPLAHPHAERLPVREPLFRPHVPDELDPLQQPLAADVADDAVLLRQPPEAGPQPLALDAGVLAQVPLDDLAQHRDAGGARDR